MPAIVTHHIFGREIHDELPELIGTDADARNAFLLGNIGPDPLFCLKPASAAARYGKLGTLMHTERPTELLAAFHAHFLEDDAKAQNANREQRVARAYAFGFLCHYLLDSIVHPLVYAQEQAIRAAGVPGLSASQLAGAAHALIETELDERVLTAKLGLTVEKFAPHKETLPSENWALTAISQRFGKAASQTYDLQVPTHAFETSVQLYRAAQFFLDAQRFGVRSRLGYARLLGEHYPRVLALSHEAKLRFDTMFANDDRIPWPHPFEEGHVVVASFDELYQQAFTNALEWLPRYAQHEFSQADCANLTNGLNFRGQRVDPASEA